jgi:Nuclease-related domain
METGTTQVDHILLSRFGVFVIETKDFNGWIFGQATDAMWTSVYFRRKVKFQNPIHQNYRHLCAVRELLAFVPPDSIKSLVVFTGSAEFKTEMPPGVLDISELVDSIRLHTERIMSPNRLQFCVGRLETTRLAITATTDVEHVESLNQRFRERAV